MKKTTYCRQGYIKMAAIFGGLLLLSALIIHWDLDRRIAGRFFSNISGWYLGNNQPWRFLYHYGTIPGILLTVMALVGYLACLIKKRYRHWQHYFLLIVLTSVIGSGILVNAILKPYWGRPRPRETIEFGGALKYQPMYIPGEPGFGSSFTCGHSTMGFIFITLFFFYRRSRALAIGGLIAGLAIGSLLSLVRILQGAHYLSDSIWSFGIILLTATWLYYFVLRIPISAPMETSS